ncbi:hypothetical protein cand_032210 [Cryptosporidium andersoni]|uniref:Uncharacterized protein n=1 Tax=Cryptosporidium andersoni TaxID=117008 RepID=A0A1J4MEQ8_9CRYT|nr:hypothetical protein cand_032210 [Cryptosporidium andersoni]
MSGDFAVQEQTRLKDLLLDRQEALKEQRKVLESINKQSDALKIGDDIDNIINSILNEVGLNESIFTVSDIPILATSTGSLKEYTPTYRKGLQPAIAIVDLSIAEVSKEYFEKSTQADTIDSTPCNITSGLATANTSNKSFTISIPVANINDTSLTDDEALAATTPNTITSAVKVSNFFDEYNENKGEVLKSGEFMEFFNKTSRIIERTLGESAIFDPFFDIRVDSTVASPDITLGSPTSTNPGNIDSITSNGIFKNSQLYHCELSINRPIMDIKSHSAYPEYFIVAYGGKTNQLLNPSSTSNPTILDYGGCALLWSISMPRKPELVFIASSAVLRVSFNPYNQHRFIGTTYNGEILIWDSRSGKIPVQKTNIMTSNTNNIHCFPVYSMELLGNKGAQNIISIDADGKVCSWNLTNINDPIESFQLKKSNSRDIAIKCMTLSKLINPNNIYCGAEDGSIYQTVIKTNKPGVIHNSVNAHSGFVTSLDYHPICDCFLSASADWTVKLWSPNSNTTVIQNTTNSSSITLLCTFESSENYVIDVAWHPIHPGIFAVVDADNNLIIYDLTQGNWQAPVCKITTSNNNSNTSLNIANSINWSSDGTRLFIGYTNGDLIMCNTDTKIYQPSRNTWNLFNERLESFKFNNGDTNNSSPNLSKSDRINSTENMDDTNYD